MSQSQGAQLESAMHPTPPRRRLSASGTPAWVAARVVFGVHPLEGAAQWEIRCDKSALVIRPIRPSEEKDTNTAASTTSASKANVAPGGSSDSIQASPFFTREGDAKKSVFDFEGSDDKDPKLMSKVVLKYSRKTVKLNISEDIVIPYDAVSKVGVSIHSSPSNENLNYNPSIY